MKKLLLKGCLKIKVTFQDGSTKEQYYKYNNKLILI